MAGTGYIIRTANGDRGPYSVEQIRAFANAGKLPLHARIRDVAATRTVSVQQVVNGSSEFAMVAAGTEDLATAEEAMAPPAPKSASASSSAAARPSRTGSQRRTTRSVKRPVAAKAGGTSRSTRKPASAASEPAATRATGRVTRRRSPTGGMRIMIMWIVGGVIVVSVAIAFAMRAGPPPPPAPKEAKTGANTAAAPVTLPSGWHGRWEVDLDATRAAAKDATLQPPQVVLAVSATAVGITIDDQQKAGTVRTATAAHIDVDVPGDAKPLVLSLDLEAEGRMRCTFANATVILVRR